MQELQAYRHAFERLPEGVRAAEAQAERTIVMEASVSGGRSTGMEYSDKTELFVRATGEKTGMAAGGSQGPADSASWGRVSPEDAENRTIRPVSKYVRSAKVFGCSSRAAISSAVIRVQSRSAMANRMTALPTLRLRCCSSIACPPF